MTIKEILSELKALKHDPIFKHNLNWGATEENQFGVKKGDLRKLAKRIKSNHQLGLELWNTGYLEAKLIAILIMNPKELNAQDLNELVQTTNFTHVADWFSSYLLKGHVAREELLDMWVNSDNKWAARAGWSLMAGKVARDSDALDLAQLLDRLQNEMLVSPSEVQWTMNTTLVYIGIHHEEHRQRALDLGNEMGIYKDYPVAKGCTSPFAPIWIEEMVKRAEK